MERRDFLKSMALTVGAMLTMPSVILEVEKTAAELGGYLIPPEIAKFIVTAVYRELTPAEEREFEQVLNEDKKRSIHELLNRRDVRAFIKREEKR